MEVSLLITILYGLVAIIISMSLHEAMHAYVSTWLGDDTAKAHGRLTFNPLAHIDWFTTVLMPLVLLVLGAPPLGVAKPVPFDPSRLRFGEYGSALVGVAGPTTNLILAIIAGLGLRLFSGSEFIALFLEIFCLINLSFFLFNMIPFPPLDGSRLLFALAPDFVRKGMMYIESAGFMAIIGFFFIFYLFLTQPFSNLLSSVFQLITGR